MHYNFFRYYDPEIGRYLRVDPIGLAGGNNPFIYTRNNPVNNIDSEGLNSIPVWVIQLIIRYPAIARLLPFVIPTAYKVYIDYMPTSPSYTSTYQEIKQRWFKWDERKRSEALKEISDYTDFLDKYLNDELNDCISNAKGCSEKLGKCFDKYNAGYNKYIQPLKRRAGFLKMYSYTTIQHNIYNLPVQLKPY